MKVDKKNVQSDPRVTQELLLFQSCYEYTHNMKGIQSDAFNYSPSNIMCYDFDELLENSKSLLFNKESNLKSEIINLKKTIYYANETKDVKKKIIAKLENMLVEKNKKNEAF